MDDASRESPGDGRSAEEIERACVAHMARGHGGNRQRRWPASSLVALLLCGAVTVGLWIPISLLTTSSGPGDAAAGVVACVICAIIVVAQFAILWYFEPGVLTSIVIAFVLWWHLLAAGFLAVVGLVTLFGGGSAELAYDGPNLIFGCCVPCVVLFVAVVHGIVWGSRSGWML